MTSAPEVDLTHDEVRRCSRHLIVPEVGLDGQRALKQARVLLVGAGGLGSPTAMYLAAAGVGVIGIVDGDVVDAGDRIFAHSRARTLGSSLVLKNRSAPFSTSVAGTGASGCPSARSTILRSRR